MFLTEGDLQAILKQITSHSKPSITISGYIYAGYVPYRLSEPQLEQILAALAERKDTINDVTIVGLTAHASPILAQKLADYDFIKRIALKPLNGCVGVRDPEAFVEQLSDNATLERLQLTVDTDSHPNFIARCTEMLGKNTHLQELAIEFQHKSDAEEFIDQLPKTTSLRELSLSYDGQAYKLSANLTQQLEKNSKHQRLFEKAKQLVIAGKTDEARDKLNEASNITDSLAGTSPEIDEFRDQLHYYSGHLIIERGYRKGLTDIIYKIKAKIKDDYTRAKLELELARVLLFKPEFYKNSQEQHDEIGDLLRNKNMTFGKDTFVFPKTIKRGDTEAVKKWYRDNLIDWPHGNVVLALYCEKENKPEEAKHYYQEAAYKKVAIANVALGISEPLDCILHAAKEGNTVRVTQLLQKFRRKLCVGPDLNPLRLFLNKPDSEGFTALDCAINQGLVEMTRVLVSHGALNVNSQHCFTQLYRAIPHNNVDLIEPFLKDSIRLNTVVEQMTSLQLAASLGFTRIVKKLLAQNDVVVEAGKDKNNTALHIATNSKNAIMVMHLLFASGNIDYEDEALFDSLCELKPAIREALYQVAQESGDPKKEKAILEHSLNCTTFKKLIEAKTGKWLPRTEGSMTLTEITQKIEALSSVNVEGVNKTKNVC